MLLVFSIVTYRLRLLKCLIINIFWFLWCIIIFLWAVIFFFLNLLFHLRNVLALLNILNLSLKLLIWYMRYILDSMLLRSNVSLYILQKVYLHVLLLIIMIIIKKPLSCLPVYILSTILINHLWNFLFQYLLWAYRL